LETKSIVAGCVKKKRGGGSNTHFLRVVEYKRGIYNRLRTETTRLIDKGVLQRKIFFVKRLKIHYSKAGRVPLGGGGRQGVRRSLYRTGYAKGREKI